VTFSDDITTLALELAKSLWAELGVGGARCRHDWQALDLEPLVVFTASLTSIDDAFIKQTIRWCALNSSCLSMIRLRNLSRRFAPATRGSLDVYMRATDESAKSNVLPRDWPDLKRPSLIQLRLRALVGVGARAEVLKLLLADPEEAKGTPDIARSAAFGTLGCAHSLDGLRAAGVVQVEQAGSMLRYRLTRPSDLAMAVNGVPVAFPDWIAVFNAIDAIREYAARDGHNDDPANRVAAAGKLAGWLRTQFGRLGITAQVPDVRDGTSVTEFEKWARLFVAEHAGATFRADVNEASYAVHRLALGGWIATVTVAGGQPRPLALSDLPMLRPERRKQRRTKTDPLGDAAVVVEMMLQDLLTRAVQRRLGSTVSGKAASDRLVPEVSREFAAELLLPMHAGEAASFSEMFLQRWLANRRHWHEISA
jgi:hypothetical protein